MIRQACAITFNISAWHDSLIFILKINIMGSVKNLKQQPAIDKVKELAEDAKLCMFCTRLTETPFNTRPMATQKIEDDGVFWFFSPADSDKNADIAADNRVQLIYSNRSSSEYLSIYGTAEIIVDPVKAKELWNIFLTTWFHEGPEDPTLTLIKVTPEQGHYWDTKNNKMVQSLKIVVGAIKGKMMDDGVEGNVVLS
jgi:general stress protein 26